MTEMDIAGLQNCRIAESKGAANAEGMKESSLEGFKS
jgi:hypothetical protein